MNNPRRKKIRDAVGYLEIAKNMIDDVRDEEIDAMDNVPENLQYSDRCSDMADNIDSFTDAIERIDDAIGHLEGAL